MALKEYLSNRYQGSESFLEEVIIPIFGEEAVQKQPGNDLIVDFEGLSSLAEATGIKSAFHVASIYLNEGMEKIDIFDITVSNHVLMERNRVNIQRIIRRIMDTYSGAFMIFHYDSDKKWDWRFSFCNKGNANDQITESKRYTFLLGPGQSCRTAADNFDKLASIRHSKGDVGMKDIISAFDVEALSKEFFDKYKFHYNRFVNYMCDPANGMRKNFINKSLDTANLSAEQIFDREAKPIRDYVKKMLGRIVFLHFLQKKGWLGVEPGKEWGEGSPVFMYDLFSEASEEQKNDFLDKVLEPLFACALNIDRSSDGDLYDTKVVGLANKGILRIPYLNGGLFVRSSDDEPETKFPASFFSDLFDFFSQYNFTIDENDPNDAQVGIDPEMLGRIFENLLEDNKDKGAFYTPKEIVRYMCRESLISYLQTDKNEKENAEIRKFVETHIADNLEEGIKNEIDIKLKDVKVCDPAIGSGAFPMGMLKELFLCRGALETFEDPARIKREIIKKNIYGVDIEKGAVDIARLRFWLSLVVDEHTPQALPNMDFKIMQGNSLLECYKGVDLSKLIESNPGTIDFAEGSKDILQRLINEYYEADNDAKHFIRTEIDNNVSNQLSENVYNVDMSNVDLAGNDQFFLWHTWFSEVFPPKKTSIDGGFDIVIGNPPYIQLQCNGGALGKLYQDRNFLTFASTGDIYSLFYEQGWNLLKSKGHLCFITSNKWMRAGYGIKTREFFVNHTNPCLLLDLGGLKIFDSATVDTNILLFEKAANSHKTRCFTVNNQSKDCINNLSDFVKQQGVFCDFISSKSWVILSPIEQDIKRKIEAIGTPLKDWDIQINYGIKTGFNDAFIITTEKREEILNNCLTTLERIKTEELIRPILRGRDIKRYGYSWPGLWIIATFPSKKYDINDYPSVKEHLLSFGKERLEQTGITHVLNGKKVKARKKTNNKWFETQDSISYWEDFSQPKIVYADISQSLSFSLDTCGFFLSNTAYFITSKDFSVLPILQLYLNSKVINWYYKTLSVQLGENAVRMFSIYMLQIAIPKNIRFDCLTDNKDLEKEICKSYGLSDKEIEYILSSDCS